MGKIGDWLWRIPVGQVSQLLPCVRLSECRSCELFLEEAFLHTFGDERAIPITPCDTQRIKLCSFASPRFWPPAAVSCIEPYRCQPWASTPFGEPSRSGVYTVQLLKADLITVHL